MREASRIFGALLAALILATSPSQTSAQSYPARTVTIVVPVAAGGGIDTTARLLAAELQAALGRPFVVENRSGASGNLGTAQVARAAPDGHTLLFTISGFHTTNPALFANLQWDPVRDFQGVAMLLRSYLIAVVNKEAPYNTLGDLIAYGRANPGKLTYGSPGVGTQTHIGAAWLAQMANMEATAVPYHGTGPAFNDLLTGTLGYFTNVMQQLMGPIQGGAVKALAVASPTREAMLPNIPTTAEAGLPGLEIDTWYAMYAPAGTPKDVVDLLSGEIKKLTERPDFKAKVVNSGSSMFYLGPDELNKYTAEQVTHWGEIIRKLGIPMQQ
jgi:tripartite-type tricarboxylate transporter receptor subunit TctC